MTMMSCLQTCIRLMIVGIAISWNGAAVHGRMLEGELLPAATQILEMVFYLHEQFVSVPGYEATDILIANPSGNASAYAFGNFGVSEQVIREGVSNTSTVIGRAPGTFQALKEYKQFALYKLLTLTTDEYSGTIVVFSDWFSEADSNEWTIVGGTGAFRMARGYATNEMVDGSPTGEYLIFKWNLTVQLPLFTRPKPRSTRSDLHV